MKAALLTGPRCLAIRDVPDPIVPVGQAFLLRQALARDGIPHSLHVLPNATHGILTERHPDGASAEVRRLVFAFLSRHLRGA